MSYVECRILPKMGQTAPHRIKLSHGDAKVMYYYQGMLKTTMEKPVCLRLCEAELNHDCKITSAIS